MEEWNHAGLYGRRDFKKSPSRGCFARADSSYGDEAEGSISKVPTFGGIRWETRSFPRTASTVAVSWVGWASQRMIGDIRSPMRDDYEGHATLSPTLASLPPHEAMVDFEYIRNASNVWSLCGLVLFTTVFRAGSAGVLFLSHIWLGRILCNWLRRHRFVVSVARVFVALSPVWTSVFYLARLLNIAGQAMQKLRA